MIRVFGSILCAYLTIVFCGSIVIGQELAEETIKEEVRELMVEYNDEITQSEAAARKLFPYYRDMYLKASVTDVGLNRWATNHIER